ATHAITTPHAPRDPAIPMGPPGAKKGGKPPKPPKPAGEAPAPQDPDGPRKRKQFIDAIADATKQAVKEASASFQEAVLGVGSGPCDVNMNRDVETPFGWWVGLNPEGTSNKTAEVLRVDSLSGKTLGILVNYGLKPCAIDNAEMAQGTRLVSSDVPGLACTLLEERYGAPVLFTMSAAGDQVPKEQAIYDVVQPDGTVGKTELGVEKGLEIVSRLGTQMARELEPIVDGITCHGAETVLKTGSTAITWPNKARTPMQPTKTVNYQPEGESEIDAHAIVLGDLALVAVKPEVNAQTEAELKAASPCANTMLISMVNGGMKYMPDRASYDRITWEALSAQLMPGAAEQWVEAAAGLLTDMGQETTLPAVTAVAQPRPDGERLCRVEIDFPETVPAPEEVQVLGHTVTGSAVSGKHMTLTLSEEEASSYVIPPVFNPGGQPPKGKPKGKPGGKPGDRPKGPGGGGQGKRPRKAISVAVKVPGYAQDIYAGAVREEVIDDFTQGVYKGIPYNLFTPKTLTDGAVYPLVMFIPDASANGNDPKVALSQGIGATTWAEPDWQEGHPCYVLAVQVPDNIQLTNDDYQAAPELETIKELLDTVVAANQVDTKRIYTTGQSQGCMASCELNVRYPGYFAGTLLVAGHWEVAKMVQLTDAKLFFGLSEGDLKGYPSMNAITDGLEQNGVSMGRVRLNFREGWEVNNRKVEEAARGNQDVYVVFDAATVFPDDGKEHRLMEHHNRGWELLYQMDSVKEWLFRQQNG
ncbi:MAG: hypothetical protein LUE61_09895, partial [Clostridiales bacterium]|nr:hypothetical protein [Clostridiales bacterium]